MSAGERYHGCSSDGSRTRASCSRSNFYSRCYFPARKRKWKRLYVIVPATACIILFGYLYRDDPGRGQSYRYAEYLDEGSGPRRVLLQDMADASSMAMPSNMTVKGSNFPPDLFTAEQRKNGAITLHIFGLLYMFVALAIVCDEFFIPALDVITEKMGISEDVAGATFMAAGGSAPELFTSIIGVFVSLDDVGIGTIVGSAVFNILFVISMCAIFSKTVLVLTWWPLFRDVSFYAIILMCLMYCFTDSKIHWYESLFLLCWYGGYVTFMSYNETIERFVKRMLSKVLNRNKVTTRATNGITVAGVGGTPPIQRMNGRRVSMPMLHGGSKFRQGVLQLMIHSVDPLHQEILQAQQQQQQLTEGANGPLNGSRPPSSSGKLGLGAHQHTHPPGVVDCTLCTSTEDGGMGGANGTLAVVGSGQDSESNNNPSGDMNKALHAPPIHLAQAVSVESDGEKSEPLDVSWPSLWYKKITYVLLFLIIIPLWLTLPDVRRPEKKRFFAGSFLGSILWIAVFSYLMVWWATLVGETFNVPVEIMGLTFLAAGTSIPDLITSVLVARKGFGDMAVSSSVGSNIFDVTVGLPLPWFLYSLIYGTVTVNSDGMACSILILFIMLIFVILTIGAFKWRLNVGMAFVMFFLYFVFIVLSLMMEKGTIKCAEILGALGV